MRGGEPNIGQTQPNMRKFRFNCRYGAENSFPFSKHRLLCWCADVFQDSLLLKFPFFGKSIDCVIKIFTPHPTHPHEFPSAMLVLCYCFYFAFSFETIFCCSCWWYFMLTQFQCFRFNGGFLSILVFPFNSQREKLFSAVDFHLHFPPFNFIAW